MFWPRWSETLCRYVSAFLKTAACSRYSGCPRKNETHFHFMITLKLFNRYKELNIPNFRYINYPHLCKITVQLLWYILRYCVKTENNPFSFLSEMGFSHIYLVDNLLFLWMTNTSLFCQVFLSKVVIFSLKCDILNVIYITSHFVKS